MDDSSAGARDIFFDALRKVSSRRLRRHKRSFTGQSGSMPFAALKLIQVGILTIASGGESLKANASLGLLSQSAL